MTAIERICNLEYVCSVLQEEKNVDEIVETLVLKAVAEAPSVESLDKLEGPYIVDGSLRILKQCPMMQVLKAIAKENLARTGKESLPNFYKNIVSRYIEENPGEGAVLHPLCIVHQAMRDIISSEKGTVTRQIACRSAMTGEVVFAKNGMALAGMTVEQAESKLGNYACLYATKALK